MKKSWSVSSLLGGSEAEKEAARRAKAAAAAAKQEAAVAELRRVLDSPEGREIAAQLVQAGEFGRDGDPALLLSDAVLRRWLVARDWDVAVTHKLIADHAAWCMRHKPDGYIHEERIREAMDANTAFIQGVDHEGRALVIIAVRNHISAKRDLRQMRLYSAHILDSLVALCDTERNPQRRVVAMFDMSGSSMANMDVACMRSILGLLSVHYVERLSALYFYDPPRIFFGLWGASKHLVPEATARKIKMIAPSDLSELQACVPPEVLPREYGGTAELIPAAAAARRFALPPFDGRRRASEDDPAAARRESESSGASFLSIESADAEAFFAAEAAAAAAEAEAAAAAAARPGGKAAGGGAASAAGVHLHARA